MGQEKLEAAAESSTRMLTEAMAFNQHLARLLLRQMQAQTVAWAGATLAAPHGWMTAYARLVQGAFTNSQAIGAAVGHTLLRSAAAGLKPIHARVRANPKRLRRRKRR